MPINSYVNPGANQPDLPGFLSAFFAPQQNAQAQDQQELQRRLLETNSQMEKEKLGTYQLDSGVRAAERNPKISGFKVEDMLNQDKLSRPGFAQAVNQGVMGEGQEKYAKGQLTTRTLDTNVAKTNIGNQNASMEGAAHQIQMIAAAHGPMAANMAYQQFLETMDPQMRNQMPRVWTPELGDSMMGAAVQSPAHNRDIAREIEHGNSSVRAATTTGTFGLSREQIQQSGLDRRNAADIAAGRYDYANRGQETPAKAMARLRYSLSQNPHNQAEVDELKSHLEDQWNTQTQRDPGISLLRIQALTATDPAAKQAAEQKYAAQRQQFFAEKGIYLNAPPAGTVKNGYKFSGGFGKDPAKKENWEKVDQAPAQQAPQQQRPTSGQIRGEYGEENYSTASNYGSEFIHQGGRGQGFVINAPARSPAARLNGRSFRSQQEAQQALNQLGIR